MRTQFFSLKETELWDDLVISFEKYDIYYLSGYVKGFQIHGDGEPHLFYFESDQIRALNVILIRDVADIQIFSGLFPKNTYYDAATPYGYGGMLIEGECNEKSLMELDGSFTRTLTEKNIICEFVRFHPVLKNSKKVVSIYEVLELSKTITLDLESYETIWTNMTTKNRNMIRKAEKNNVSIHWGNSTELFQEFAKQYNHTMNRDHAADYYYFNNEFYKSIQSDLKDNAILFYAQKDNDIIAMSIILYANGQLHYHLSGSNEDYRRYAPSNLLLYKAACWGCEQGYTTFHLGGGLGSQEDSLYKFKKAFTRQNPTQFSIGKKIFNESIYRELLDMRVKHGETTIDVSCFPPYRS